MANREDFHSDLFSTVPDLCEVRPLTRVLWKLERLFGLRMQFSHYRVFNVFAESLSI